MVPLFWLHLSEMFDDFPKLGFLWELLSQLKDEVIGEPKFVGLYWGWGGRWGGLRDTPWFIIWSIIKNSFVIACIKVCTFSCKLCVLSRKKLSYLSIFSSKFCWNFSSPEFVLVGVFGRFLWYFFYFCDCPTFPPFSVEKFILLKFYYYFH